MRIRFLPLLSGLTIDVAMSCGVGYRHGSDLALLWLWRRPVATALIRPLAWEPPCAAGAAHEIAKRQKKKSKLTDNQERQKHIARFLMDTSTSFILVLSCN